MAQNILRLRFNLRDPKATKHTPINLIVRYNNQKHTFPTSENVLPKNWQGDKEKKGYQRAKQGQGFVEFSELNQRLDNIINDIKDIFRRFRNDNNNEVPTWDKLKHLLELHFELKSAPVKSFIPFIKQFIEDAPTGRTNPKTGKLISLHTIKKYRTTLNHIEKFVAETGKKIDFENIDVTFCEDYKKFLMEYYNHSVNSINKDIRIIKLFLNEATERGINKNLAYKSNKFTATTEVSDSIYLNDAELKLLFDLDLTDNETYDRVKDLFLIACHTGLRYSDYSALSDKDIVDGKIKVITRKTNDTVIIPLRSYVKKIFEKYNYKLPKSLSNQKTNKYLKEIGEKIPELHILIDKKITQGGTRNTFTQAKYKMITTHTGRRSFATNLFLSKFPAISIMKITGHRTEGAFMRYIKITPNDVANGLEVHWEEMEKEKLGN